VISLTTAMFNLTRMGRPFRAIQRRKLSTSRLPYNNFTKLTGQTSSINNKKTFSAHPTFEAFPFSMLPQEAVNYLSIFAATACNIRKVPSSVAAFFFPFLNVEPMRPVRISAVYFPTWFVNGEVEANITYKGIQVCSFFCFISLVQVDVVTEQGDCLV
jgi:hypothetical protein